MQTLNPYFKGSVVGPLAEVIYANKRNYKNFTFRVLPEILFSIPLAMYFPKNHYLVNEVNTKISILHAAGLINRWTSEYLGMTYTAAPAKGPKKLNLEQLEGGIFIFVIGCVVGSIIFLFEKLAIIKIYHKKFLQLKLKSQSLIHKSNFA